MLKLDDVSREFGNVKAVSGLTLSLEKGEVMGFLGTNGAGKTTTIKMLLGLIKPTSGSVSVMGGDPSDPVVRAKIGYMPEIAYYYPYLNACELMSFYGGICGLDAKTVRSRTAELLAAVGLADAVARARFDFKTDNDPVAAKRAFSSACELALRKCNGDLSSLPESEAREYRLAQSYLEHLN